MTMNDSTGRGIRTGYQALIGILTSLVVVIPLMLAILSSNPSTEQVALVAGPTAVGIATWCGAIAKILNMLEDKFSWFPAFFKGNAAALPTLEEDPEDPEDPEPGTETDPESESVTIAEDPLPIAEEWPEADDTFPNRVTIMADYVAKHRAPIEPVSAPTA